MCYCTKSIYSEGGITYEASIRFLLMSDKKHWCFIGKKGGAYVLNICDAIDLSGKEFHAETRNEK